MMRSLILRAARAYIVRELPGWGRVYRRFVGSYERNAAWQDAAPCILRDKRDGLHRIADPREWADRLLYFLGGVDEVGSQIG